MQPICDSNWLWCKEVLCFSLFCFVLLYSLVSSQLQIFSLASFVMEEIDQPQWLQALVRVSQHLSANEMTCFGMALIGLGGFMFVSGPENDLSPPESVNDEL